jgi:integrase
VAPADPTERIRLKDLVNRFMDAKDARHRTGELSIHTWRDYARVCDEFVKAFGAGLALGDLQPSDFEKLRATWAARWSHVRLGNYINLVRVVFNFGYENGLLEQPMRYGSEFTRPSKKTLRIAKANKGPRKFERDEVRRMIDGAAQPLKAMILLGINAGLGNNDCAMLPIDALDLKKGWLDYSRPKTGIVRRCPLWPETVTAIKEWLTQRPTPFDEAFAGRLFITSRRGTWAKNTTDNPITKETTKLLDTLEIPRGKARRNFYTLRHTFETIAGESRDQVAVDAIMGHVDDSMAAQYREGISDERLQAVAMVVHKWLYKKEKPRLKVVASGFESDGAMASA